MPVTAHAFVAGGVTACAPPLGLLVDGDAYAYEVAPHTVDKRRNVEVVGQAGVQPHHPAIFENVAFE